MNRRPSGAGRRRRGSGSRPARWPARLRAVWSPILLALLGSLFLAPDTVPAEAGAALAKLQLAPAIERALSRAIGGGEFPAAGPEAAGRAAATAALALLAALAVLASARAVGRFYCSFLCPLGALQDAFIAIRRFAGGFWRRRGPRRGFGAPDLPLAQAAAFALAVGSAAAGAPALLGYIEPWSAFGKIASGLARPLADLAQNAAAGLARALGSWAIALGPVSWEAARAAAGAIALGVAGSMSLAAGRLSCNLLCPAGALLRIASRRPAVGLVFDREACSRCGACAAACRASCIGDGGAGADEGRCVRCLDCLAACPTGAISLGPRPRRPAATEANPDDPGRGAAIGRRGFLAGIGALGARSALRLAARPLALRAGALAGAAASGAAGGAALAAAAPRLRSYEALMAGVARRPAAPPGAGKVDRFLGLCTACGACAAVCPSGTIAPSLFEWGILDAGKPFLAYDRAYCQFECDRCSRACPTGALVPLGLEAKKRARAGRSVLDLELCIVRTKGTRCGACAEHCPTGAAAMAAPAGERRGPPEPRIDEAACIGCGACETVCPAKPSKAIRVEGRAVQDEALVLGRRPGDEADVQGAPAAPAPEEGGFPF